MVDEHAHCPHCRRLLLEHAPYPYPERPVRCSGCRLLVGPGRARDANGRPRRASSRLAGAPRTDAVLGVLEDVRAQTRDEGLRGVAGLVGDR
jgi:hypothetical protein